MMGDKLLCHICGKYHKMAITPHVDNYVICPYDVEGKAVRKGMEGASPRMEVNQYGVLCWAPPKRCDKCGEWCNA